VKRCTRCVLSERYPGIEFNEEGVCNYCLTHKKWRYKGEEELGKLLGSFRNKGERYDCLVGVSGGRDSSYALYYLVKVCDLRVLAYTSETGFIPESARINMENMTDILGIDLVVEEHDFLRKCIKHNFSSWLRKPSPAMIPMICCGCKLGGYGGTLEYARKNKIPLVVFNIETPVERGQLKHALLVTNPLGRIAGKSRALSLFSGLLYELMKAPFYFLNPRNTMVYVAEYLYFFSPRLIQRFYPNQTVVLDLYRYIEWNEDKILSTIRSELNWRQDADSTSSWRFDCKVSFLKNYLLRELVGVTEKDDGLSAMIREDMITREEALERLKTENIIPEELITEVCDQAGLSDEEKTKVLRIREANSDARVSS
jgi:hypothetical protein